MQSWSLDGVFAADRKLLNPPALSKGFGKRGKLFRKCTMTATTDRLHLTKLPQQRLISGYRQEKIYQRHPQIGGVGRQVPLRQFEEE